MRERKRDTQEANEAYELLEQAEEVTEPTMKQQRRDATRKRQRAQYEWNPEVAIEAWPPAPDGGSSGPSSGGDGEYDEDYHKWKKLKDKAHDHPDTND